MIRKALIQFIAVAVILYIASTVFIAADWWINSKRLIDHAFMFYLWIIVFRLIRYFEISTGLVLVGISYLIAKEFFNVGDSIYTTCLNFINPEAIDKSFNAYRGVCTFMAIAAGMLVFFSLVVGVNEKTIARQPWIIRKIYYAIKDME